MYIFDAIMEFVKSLLYINHYYGVAILNCNNVKWFSIDKNTLCCNLYTFASNIFNVNIKSIKNENEIRIPRKSNNRIILYLDDGFCIKCSS